MHAPRLTGVPPSPLPPLPARAELAAMLAERIDNKEQRYFLTREQEYLAGLNAAVGIWRAPGGPRRKHAVAHSAAPHTKTAPLRYCPPPRRRPGAESSGAS